MTCGRNDLWSWWQHYKYHPGIIVIMNGLNLYGLTGSHLEVSQNYAVCAKDIYS